MSIQNDYVCIKAKFIDNLIGQSIDKNGISAFGLRLFQNIYLLSQQSGDLLSEVTALSQLRHKYGEAELPSIVAFFGIQNPQG